MSPATPVPIRGLVPVDWLASGSLDLNKLSRSLPFQGFFRDPAGAGVGFVIPIVKYIRHYVKHTIQSGARTIEPPGRYRT